MLPIWVYPVLVFSVCVLFTKHFKPLGVAGIFITSLFLFVFYYDTPASAIDPAQLAGSAYDENFDFKTAEPTPTAQPFVSGIALSSLDSEQNQTLDAIISIGLARNVPERYILAAIATGLAEDNLHNSAIERDADSQNWRQERRLFYSAKWAQTGGSLNLDGSVNRFYDECRKKDRDQSAGELAADVQRPKTWYRGRYQQRMAEAEKLYNEWITKKNSE